MSCMLFQVLCWNTGNGCDFTGSVSSTENHYQKECLFHCVTCPRCRDSVLQRNIVKHYSAGCCPVPSNSSSTNRNGCGKLCKDGQRDFGLALDNTSDTHACLQSIVNGLTEIMKADYAKHRESWLNDMVELVQKQLREVVADLSGSTAKHTSGLDDTLTGVSSNTKTVVKTTEAISCCQNELKELVAGMNDRLNALSGKVAQVSLMTKNIVEKTSLLHCPNTLHWYVMDWNTFKTVKREESNKRYMYGYNLSCLLHLSEEDLGLYLTINAGENDQTLEWPFRIAYVLQIVHPQVGSRTISSKTNPTKCSLKYFMKPGSSGNKGAGDRLIATVAELEQNGYIEKNVLHVCLKLEP